MSEALQVATLTCSRRLEARLPPVVISYHAAAREAVDQGRCGASPVRIGKTAMRPKRRGRCIPSSRYHVCLDEVRAWLLVPSLLNRACHGRERIIGIAADQPNGTHNKHQNYGQNYRVFSDVLAPLIVAESLERFLHLYPRQGPERPCDHSLPYMVRPWREVRPPRRTISAHAKGRGSLECSRSFLVVSRL